METTQETTANKNTATLLQLSAFTQYFIPFGNFIFPAVIWSLRKKDSGFVDYNGKQALNFQLSLLLYSMILLVIAIPAFVYAIFNGMEFYFTGNGEQILNQLTTGKITAIVLIALIMCFIYVTLKVCEFCLIFYASVKNSNGQSYNYPLTIKFIK
jgi:uncharacterized Tic20 family protein